MKLEDLFGVKFSTCHTNSLTLIVWMDTDRGQGQGQERRWQTILNDSDLSEEDVSKDAFGIKISRDQRQLGYKSITPS